MIKIPISLLVSCFLIPVGLSGADSTPTHIFITRATAAEYPNEESYNNSVIDSISLNNLRQIVFDKNQVIFHGLESNSQPPKSIPHQKRTVLTFGVKSQPDISVVKTETLLDERVRLKYASDNLYLENNTEGETVISIYSLDGLLLCSGTLDPCGRFSTTTLPEGNYIAVAATQSFKLTLHFCIHRKYT